MATAEIPEDLNYTVEHEWVRAASNTVVRVGITDFAQDALGDIVFVDAPAVGAQLTQGQPYTEIESTKAVSEVFAPLSGEVIEVNELLADNPELVNEDPYGDGWMVKIRIADASEASGLLDRDAYLASLQE